MANKGIERLILLALVAIVLVLSVQQAFQINRLGREWSMKASETAAASAGGTADGNSETYEQMMARMHPDLAAQQQADSAPTAGSGAQMVGGC